MRTTTKKEQIIKLKQMHLKNSQIARLFDVSRQYVSHICQTPARTEGRAKRAGNNELVTKSAASRMLGVSEATIRRWADQGKIPAFRINIGRRDRRINARELEQVIVRTGSNLDEAS